MPLSMVRVRRAIGVVCAVVGVPLLVAFTQTPRAVAHGADRTTWDSVFTAEQADRGQAAYTQLCARCHRDALGGGDEAPALTGSAFMSGWNGLTLEELHERIRTTMPSDTPGVYTKQQVTDVLAFMLRFNGFPAGSAELTHELDALKAVKFVAGKP
jgi:mono/diheme cytochrome c family protein